MIIAMIQTKRTGCDDPNIIAVNGAILEGDEAQHYANQLYALIRDVPSHLDTEEILSLAEHLLCVQFHPERDDGGRIRPALVLWSKDESMDHIQQTLQVMGLDAARFDELYSQYETKERERLEKERLEQERLEKQKRMRSILLASGAILTIFTIAYMIKK